MASLFQDEPDEDEGPSLFQRESELGEGMFPLQDEPDETEPCNAAAVGIHHVPPQLFQDEVDEASDAASDSSGFFGDCETDAHHGSRQELVQLSFATLTKFLETQLCNVSAKKDEPMVKKRRYNNQVRAAKAAANKHISTPKRVPRNDPESWCSSRFVVLFFPSKVVAVVLVAGGGVLVFGSWFFFNYIVIRYCFFSSCCCGWNSLVHKLVDYHQARIDWWNCWRGLANVQRSNATASSPLMRRRNSWTPSSLCQSWNRTAFCSWRGLMRMDQAKGAQNQHVVSFTFWGSTWRECVSKAFWDCPHTESIEWVL